MKKIINSNQMKWFRKLFLEKIHSDIFYNKSFYCCLVSSIYGIFIHWNELKEVQNNLHSIYLNEWMTSNKCNYLNIEESWFEDKESRLNFLKECISML